MAEDDKVVSRDLIGKIIVSKSGKKFGEVGDIIFETRSGELINIAIVNPTTYAQKLELEKEKDGTYMIPFSSVIAMGDFLVVAEEDII